MDTDTWLFRDPSIINTPPKTLDVFIMSACPDAVYALKNLIRPVANYVEDLVKVNLNYIGNFKNGSHFGVECRHGLAECQGNAAGLW